MFFTNEHVPQYIKIADQTETVVSFLEKCKNGELLHSDFPPRANNRNHIKCLNCSMEVTDCAFIYFNKMNSSVVKLYSFRQIVCSYYPVKVRGWFRVKMLAAHKRVVILPPIFPIFVCKQFKMFEN